MSDPEVARPAGCAELELRLLLHNARRDEGVVGVARLIGTAAACCYALETNNTCPYQARIDAADNQNGYEVNKYNQAGKPLDRPCPHEVKQLGQGNHEELYRSIVEQRSAQANPDVPPAQEN